VDKLRLSERYRDFRREAAGKAIVGAVEFIASTLCGRVALSQLEQHHDKAAIGYGALAVAMAAGGALQLREALESSRDAGQELEKLSQVPDTLAFMPPEEHPE
jgi:hypothetical protein